MYNNYSRLACGIILLGVVGVSQGCQTSAPPISSEVSGTHVSQGADLQGDEKQIQAILAMFKKAEEAVRREDLDALMALYADDYKHGGYNKDGVRAVWNDLFARHRDFAGAHIFSKIKVETGKPIPLAHVTCTGSLWAISDETGQRVNIDSWYGEVHHVTFDHGAWHLAGTFWEIPRGKESRPAFLPHPFF